MTVPQMPAANAASKTTKRRAATVRCETNLVPAVVPFPVESDVGIGSKVVAGEDPLAAASLAREVGGRLGRRAEADDQDEDSDRATEAAHESLARYVEDVRDAGADVIRGGLAEVRLRFRDVLGRRRRGGLRHG